ncbi:uncharacterized protein G2W53_018165 [Senna tora]|uniref:Uncharacterized protein n=1 Tax=Senna tora TaxID=362788 RepID=A0A834WPM3_9FABA|nr:uncharacterized protein G2W53_018165 [Senna tora]
MGGGVVLQRRVPSPDPTLPYVQNRL